MMIKRRTKVDGLPFRVYERLGVRKYNIGYKLPSGDWAFSYSCDASDTKKMREIRNQAIAESIIVSTGQRHVGGVADLIDAWFEYQHNLPLTDSRRRAESTLAENRRESENLKKSFGHMALLEITKTHGYAYLDVCVQNARPIKGNKEIALFQVILEYAVRLGDLNSNPLAGIRKNRTTAKKRFVTDAELNLAVAVGLQKGGARYIVSLALKTAWLCVKRSVEVRALTRDCIGKDGITWKDGKSKTKADGLIEWSDELRETIQAALEVKRNYVAGSMYVFGNMRGQKYTKGGWKAILSDLMRDCMTEAARLNIEFKPFSLQDCRPKGVSDKLMSGQTDAQEATGHTSSRMISQVYDVRTIKKAKPVR